MYAHKMSVSLPQPLYEFVEDYQMTHHCKNRSEVVGQAIKLLQQSQLEADYLEANAEIDNAFEATSLDGLEENETW